MKQWIRVLALLLGLSLLWGCAQTIPEETEPPVDASSEGPTETPEAMDWFADRTTSVSYPMDDASQANRALAQELYAQLLQTPPVDFLYGGSRFSQTLSEWERRETPVQDGMEVVYTHADTGMALRLEYLLYDDGSAVEWKVRLHNTGSENSLLVEDFKSLTLSAASKGNTRLFYSKGGNATDSDFEPISLSMKNGDTYSLSSKGGRSSSGTMPFFNLYTAKDAGFIGAIGWSGQWTLNARKQDGLVTLDAGMTETAFYLEPGEDLRQPSMLLLPWEGDPQEAHNDLRHYMVCHHTMRMEDGSLPVGPISYGVWGGEGAKTQCSQIKALNNLNIGYEILWIDAGWHGDGSAISQNTFDSVWVENTGTWDDIDALYPNGMAEVSDSAHAAGMGLLLWFEPERAFQGTQLVTEHPQWFLSDVSNPNNFIFNLGDPEAREWLCDYVAGLIQEYGVDIYRQDFNIEPLSYWQASDGENRTGVTEMKYIEGLYLYWEGLRQRCPGLIIDNCASGGRRLDFESLSRSVCLFRSDYVCDAVSATAEANQLQIYGLNFWLPVTGTSSMGRTDAYNFRSTYGFSMQTPNILAKSEEQQLVNAEFRKLRNYFYGDYYPLTECTNDTTGWFAYQMHREDLTSGFVCAFRRLSCKEPYLTVKLSGLQADAGYTVTILDTGESVTLTGQELMTTGLVIQIDRQKESRMIFYELAA